MNPFHLPPALVETLGWVLLHSVWQLALVALVAMTLARAMRRSSARARYAMLAMALAVMTASPVLTLLVLPKPEPMAVATEQIGEPTEAPPLTAVLETATPETAGERPAVPQSARPMRPALGVIPAVASDADAPSRLPAEPRSLDFWGQIAACWSSVEQAVRAWLPTIVGLWCLGVCGFAWRPAISWYEIGRLRRVGVSPVPDHVLPALGDLARRMRLSRAVQVLASTRISVPVVVGYLRPVVLLPVSLVSQLPVPQLEAILAHELAHIRRHDYVVNLWQTLVETALFYHPAVWWLSHRIRLERENCCDDIAVAVVENRVEYGRALLALAELRGTHTALVLGARGGSLLARIGRLFPGEPGRRTFDSSNLVALGLLATSILAAVVWATAIADEPPAAAEKKPSEAAQTSDAAPAAAAAPAAEPEPAAPKAAEPDADFVDVVCDRFVAAIEKQNLPYVTPKELAACRAELHRYLKGRVKHPLTGASRDELLSAMDKFVQIMFAGPDSYLNFLTNFNSLRWQLWTATERPELTADALKERDRQRQWMFDYIRSLPKMENEQNFAPERQREGRIESLRRDVFGNPLSPFFHDPMSAEEFERFTQQLQKPGPFALPSSVGTIFRSAVIARTHALLERWPPGFEHLGGFSAGNTDFYYFNFINVNQHMPAWIVRPAANGEPDHFDLAKRNAFKEGDLWVDFAARRLMLAPGVKMTTIDQTEWYAIDRVPLAELKKRLGEAPLESLAIPAYDPHLPDGGKVLRTLPTLVFENSEGTVALARFLPSGEENTVVMRFSYRPLPSYPPFHQGDTGSEEPDLPGFSSVELAEETPEVADPAAAANSPAADADAIDVLGDRFVAALKKQKLPFVTPEALLALRAELNHYLRLRVKTPPTGPAPAELLDAMNKFVQRKFTGTESYATFRIDFDMLLWRLWTALDRPELTPDELTERDRQREWMRDYIRSLPEPEHGRTTPPLSHVGQIKRLESDVFDDRLSPFFYDPMSAKEFAEFTKQVEEFKKRAEDLQKQGQGHASVALGLAPSDIFRTGAGVRVQALQRRWPPGFQSGGLSGMGTQDFAFRTPSYNVVEPEQYQRDLAFDAATHLLSPAHGAKMATLKETEWSVVDRIPTAELRKRVREAPVESLSIPQFSQPHSPQALRAMKKLPTVVLETADGKILLVRLLEHSGGSVAHLDIHRRPQPDYTPFHPADQGYEEPDMQPLAPIATADVLGDRFAHALEQQNLPFVGPQELAALRAELHDYLEIRVAAPLYKQTRKTLSEAIDSFVLRNFSGPDCYLHFRDRFDSLKWQLWVAVERRGPGTIDQQNALRAQRAWMRDYIRNLKFVPKANGLPQPAPPVEQVEQLESEVFGNPLNPFFETPMPAEDFKSFKQRLEKEKDPESVSSRIFSAGVDAQHAAIEQRWPPGFPVHGIHTHGTQDFDFAGTSDRDAHWRSGPSPDGNRLFFDAASGSSIEQPADLDDKGTDAWLREAKKGDLWFDAKTRRLIPVRGAKLSTLAETDWYVIDRTALAALRGRLAESQLEAYKLAELPGGAPRDPYAVEQFLRKLPTLVLETAEGKIVLLRVEQFNVAAGIDAVAGRRGKIELLRVEQLNGDSVQLLSRARPLAPYPPFQPGDVEAAEK